MGCSLKTMLSSSDWFEFQTEIYSSKRRLKMRVRDFSKVNISDKIKAECGYGDNSQIWAMQIELIVLSKESLLPYALHEKICLRDQDGFCFSSIDDGNDMTLSELSHTKNFFYLNEVNPKIQISGAIYFELPDDPNQDYVLEMYS